MTRRRHPHHSAERRKRHKRVGDKGSAALAEFYREVANALDLPLKAPDDPQVSGSTQPGAATPRTSRVTPRVSQAKRRESGMLAVSGQRTRWWMPVVAVLMLAATGAYVLWPAGEATVPESFHGNWTSRSANYEGRRLVLDRKTIEVVSGVGPPIGPVVVTSSRADSSEEGVRLRLSYDAPEGAQTLELLLHPGRPATLTLARPADVIWERLAERPTAPPTAAVAPK